jgi:hypothetical protein
MNDAPYISGHWTEEELIASLYDAGPVNDHLRQCTECRDKLSALLKNRQVLESAARNSEEVSPAFLSEQRRSIYRRLSEPVPFSAKLAMRQWLPAAATLLLFGAGFIYFEQPQQRELDENKISDVQLAQEMSRMSQDLEALPVAPLQGLFE